MLLPDHVIVTAEQLAGSEHYVILACVTLGELSEKNPQSCPDMMTNILLQVDVSNGDQELWNIMDKATYGKSL